MAGWWGWPSVPRYLRRTHQKLKPGSQCPDFDDRVPTARDHVSVHITEPFYWSRVAVSHERGVLHARAVVNLGKNEGER